MRLARFMVEVMGVDQARERMIGLVRAAASGPEAARLVRDLVTRELFTPLAEAIGAPHAPLQTTLIGAHVVGLTFARTSSAWSPWPRPRRT
ncbi:hypothetical protein ACQP00_21750 [Dactylosporangium sp. CS-047395]|uniref:TetR/AcrR family transcriptional regulator n=1 Tax=Dactylosporangium sp. CS-047395 TaxID=3239936 RepID=UPI003D90575F